MSLVHTRTDPMIFSECLNFPRLKKNRDRLAMRERNPKPEVCAPKTGGKCRSQVRIVHVRPSEQQTIDQTPDRPITDLYREVKIENNAGKSKLLIILEQVSKKTGVSVDLIKSHIRTKKIMQARHEYFYRARVEGCYSYPMIGRLCNKDHTTVMHGAHRHAERNNLPAPKGNFYDRRSKAILEGGA